MLDEIWKINQSDEVSDTPAWWDEQTCQDILDVLNKEKLSYTWEEIWKLGCKIFEKYKQNSNWKNPYLNWHKTQGPFSMIDQQVEYLENSKQQREKKVEIWNQKFFTVNNVLNNMQQQLIVNRLFTPFLSMTRLLKLKDSNPQNFVDKIKKWKTTHIDKQEYVRNSVIVSSDITDPAAQDFMSFHESTPQIIQDIFRIIYQFIAKDRDRCPRSDKYPNRDHNIKNNIIYDFDLIDRWGFYYQRYDNITFEWIEDRIDEFAEILFFFKVYIGKIAHEVKPSGQSKKDIKFYNFIKEKEKDLSMQSIIMGMELDDKILDTAREIDKKISELHNERKIALS